MHYFGLEVRIFTLLIWGMWWPPRAKSTTKDFLFLLSSSRALLPKNSILIPLCASAKARWLYSTALFVWTIIGMSITMMVISYWVNQIWMIRAAALLLMTYIWRWCDRRSQHWYAFSLRRISQRKAFTSRNFITVMSHYSSLCATSSRGLCYVDSQVWEPLWLCRIRGYQRIKIDRWSIPDISS